MEKHPSTPDYSIDTKTAPVPLFDLDWDGSGEPHRESLDTGIQEVLTEAKESALKVLGEKAVAGAEKLLKQRTEHPRLLTVEDAMATLEAWREQHEDDDAYSELGGGVQRSYLESRAEGLRFTRALDAYEPWHNHTRQAIEQYRLGDMQKADFDHMTKRDRALFSSRAFAFLEGMKSTKRLIDGAGDDLRSEPNLAHLYGDSRRPEDLRLYGKILEGMVRDVEESGLTGKIRDELNIPRPGSRYYNDRRRLALDHAKTHRQRYGTLQVSYNKGRFITTLQR